MTYLLCTFLQNHSWIIMFHTYHLSISTVCVMVHSDDNDEQTVIRRKTWDQSDATLGSFSVSRNIFQLCVQRQNLALYLNSDHVAVVPKLQNHLVTTSNWKVKLISVVCSNVQCQHLFGRSGCDQCTSKLYSSVFCDIFLRSRRAAAAVSCPLHITLWTRRRQKLHEALPASFRCPR